MDAKNMDAKNMDAKTRTPKNTDANNTDAKTTDSKHTATRNESVTVRLHADNLRNPIVGPVSFSVEAGACAAICGPSGSGKSQLLRMIADLVPNQGDVGLGERRRGEMPAPQWRAQVIYVGAPAWWASTLAAHVAHDRHEKAVVLMARLGIDADYLSRPVATLSTGEAQRLALVRALVCRPMALLLDEPTSGLDAEATARVEALLADERRAGRIIVLVTHDPAQAGRLADSRHAMAAGRLSPA